MREVPWSLLESQLLNLLLRLLAELEAPSVVGQDEVVACALTEVLVRVVNLRLMAPGDVVRLVV